MKVSSKKAKEIWSSIIGFENIYEISNYGKVKSLPRKIKNGVNSFYISKEKILKFKIRKSGYLEVNLSKNGKDYFYSIHRLVAVAFLKNYKNFSEVNHIDGIKSNNYISNLEWIDYSGNMKHAYENNLVPINYDLLQKNNLKKQKRIGQYDSDMNLIASFASINEAIRITGFTGIGKCASKKYFNYKTAGGFIWRYL